MPQFPHNPLDVLSRLHIFSFPFLLCFNLKSPSASSDPLDTDINKMGSPEEESNRFIREVLGLQGAAYLVIGLRYFYRIHSMGWKKLA